MFSFIDVKVKKYKFLYSITILKLRVDVPSVNLSYRYSHGVMRHTLSSMVSCFLMSRQKAHMTSSNSQFLHI